MKTYLVGGAVRDELLGLPVKERDWVVVGATPEEMLQLGFRQVGKAFPVFLHPQTREEYALARTERKVAPGYSGFSFDTAPTVTLEEDLMRRDLTINAIAKTEDSVLIDPFHGKSDLDARLLRHVSPAFSEDPVRILRVGRFLARFSHLGFTVAPDTITLMQHMVAAGEVDALVAERVWKEWERALGEPNPEHFFTVLNDAHALPILFPGWSMHRPGMQALQVAARAHLATPVRFAVLCYDVPHDIAHIANRYRIPHHYRDLALLTAHHYQAAFDATTYTAEQLVDLFYRLDIFRRGERFELFMQAVAIIASSEKHPAFTSTWLTQCAHIIKNYDIQPLIQQNLTGPALAQALRKARIATLANHLDSPC